MAAGLTSNSCLVSRLVKSFVVFFIPPPMDYRCSHNSVSRSSFSRLNSKLSISRKFISPFRINISLHWTCHVTNPNLCLFFRSESQVGHPAVSLFHRLNWKSQTSFALTFSKTIPCSHRSFYHNVSTPNNLCSFDQVIASIISALLRLAKYSLLDKTVSPTTWCP